MEFSLKRTGLLLLLPLAAALAVSCATSGQPIDSAVQPVAADDQIKIILDCDNSMGSFFWEVDDGLVIAYLLNKPEVELLGITTVFGNRTYDHKYSERMLRDAGRTEVPLFKGAQGPDEEPTVAAKFLAETAAGYPGEVTIIAAGPVSNIEAANQIDPNFYQNVGQILVMGGITGALVFGNRDVSELNLSADYIASFEMLNSGADITVMTAQFCLDAPFTKKDLQKLDNFPYRWRRYLRHWLFTMRIGVGLNEFILWDLLPAVYAFHPEYFIEREVTLLSTTEDLETGLLRFGTTGTGPMINAPEHFADREAFYFDLFEAWNRQGTRRHR